MSASTESEYQIRIAELQAKLSKSQEHVERYRAMLTAVVTEAWKDVTPGDLVRVVEENQGIEDILAELDKASAA